LTNQKSRLLFEAIELSCAIVQRSRPGPGAQYKLTLDEADGIIASEMLGGMST